jgi:hypothetical protein
MRERGDPRQRVYPSESYAVAASGLERLGFPRGDVRRALDAVSVRHRDDALTAAPVETILCEALAVLA